MGTETSKMVQGEKALIGLHRAAEASRGLGKERVGAPEERTVQADAGRCETAGHAGEHQ